MINDNLVPVVIVNIVEKLQDTSMDYYTRDRFCQQLENIRAYCDQEITRFRRNKK